MAGNYHVLLVHFPIALLSVYAVMEIVRWPKTLFVKQAFLWLGVAGAVPTILAGLAIESEFERLGRVLELHKAFALSSVAIFALLAVAYALAYFLGKKEPSSRSDVDRKLLALAGVLTEAPIAPVVAAAGLACLFTTGALGGAMAHGSDVDPFVEFVYNLLVR